MNKNKNLLTYWLVAFILIISNSVFCYSANTTFNVTLKVFVSIIPIIYIYPYLSGNGLMRRWSVKTICVMMIYASVLFLYMMVRCSGSVAFFLKFLVFIPVVVLIELKRHFIIKVLRMVSDVVLVIAIVSLLFWIFGTVLNVINPTNVIHLANASFDRNSYFNIYTESLEAPYHNGWLSFYQNNSIFLEAPVYCGYLCIAILSECFLGKPRKIYLLIFVVAMLSTASTTGGLIIAYILYVELYEYISGKFIHNAFSEKLLGLIMVVMGGVSVIYIIIHKQNQASLAIRIEDYKNGIEFFCRRPLMGWGYGFGQGYNVGASNSVSMILSNGGMVLSLVYIIPFLLATYKNKSKGKNKLNFYLFGIYLLLSVSTIGYSYLVLLVISYEISMILDEEDEKKFECNNLL